MITNPRPLGDQEWSPSQSHGERREGAHSCAPRGHVHWKVGRDSGPSGDGPSGGTREMITNARHRGDQEWSPSQSRGHIGRARIPARHEVTYIGRSAAIPARRETGPPGRVHSPMTSEKLGGNSYLVRCPVRWGPKEGAFCAR
jgi:hypothetical protein